MLQYSEARTRAVSSPRASSAAYAARSSSEALASTRDVSPNRLAIRRPSRRPSAWSFALRAGRSFATRSAASSRSVPLGSPAASRSIRPYGGSGVAFVTPASARAFELTHTECPSAAERYAGRSGTAASSSALDGLASGKHRQVPAAPAHPGRGRMFGGVALHFLQDRRLRREPVQVALQRLDPARHRVDVRVVERRQDHLPAEIHDLRRGPVHGFAPPPVRRTRCVPPETATASAQLRAPSTV